MLQDALRPMTAEWGVRESTEEARLAEWVQTSLDLRLLRLRPLAAVLARQGTSPRLSATVRLSLPLQSAAFEGGLDGHGIALMSRVLCVQLASKPPTGAERTEVTE